MSFVHLHNHSDYSMLDGMNTLDKMVEWAVKNSAPAIALTDHGNMFGAYDFYTTATEKGVKPIIGCEVYVAPEDDRKSREKNQGSAYHLTLLAENNEGYKNLINLVSNAYIEGFYRRPRIDTEILREYNKGIIVLTGCVQSELAQLLWNGTKKESANRFRTLLDIIGNENIYVEIQNHGLEQELTVYPQLVELAKEFNLPLVGTNDCHYLECGNHEAHDVMLCVQMKKKTTDKDRIKFDNEFFFKSMDEMKEALQDYPEECITNTQIIADRCDVKLEKLENTIPKFPDLPQGETEQSYLKKLCYEGLERRITVTSAIKDRLENELKVINETGYDGYFLIVHDYVQYARRNNYPLSARGSAGGSLTLYALDVINFNPMDHGCLFERFLNTERISMPDIDIDFGDRIRDNVINYVKERYGENHVARVSTFHTLSAKSVVNDVGRSLGIQNDLLKRVNQLVASNSGDFSKIEDKVKKPEIQKLIEICKQLDGVKRHVSCHASAVVISNDPLTNHIPLFKDKHDQIASQFEGETLEKLGVVKFDFLGSKALMQTYNCLDLIKKNKDVEIKLEDIPLDDQNVYNLISKGLLCGLFQLEGSEGIRQLTMDINPVNFEEFAVITALYRPGTLQSGMTKQYIERKNGTKPIESLHEKAQDALKETYGLCVYQEQVMQIARDVAGYSLGEADVLRAAMGKLDKDLMAAQKDKFINGCIENDVSKEDAEKLFSVIETFAGYGFNKSHSVAYSLLSYHMAYLKYYYPHEFMASIYTGIFASKKDTDAKITPYNNECRKLASFLSNPINTLPPDINYSQYEFTVEENNIRFGLCCVKNLSETATEKIIDERRENGPFQTLSDFCKRLSSRSVSKKAITYLIMSGAMDCFEVHRAKLVHNLDNIVEKSKGSKTTVDSRQMDIFDLMNVETPTDSNSITLEDCNEWNEDEKRDNEKESMGFSYTSHPLDKYSETITKYQSINIENINKECEENQNVIVCGIISNRQVRTLKNGQEMLTFDLEDIDNKIDTIVFPEIYKDSTIPENGGIVLIRAETRKPTNWKSQGYKLAAREIIPIDNYDELNRDIEITIPDISDQERFDQLKSIIEEHPGEKNVLLHLHSETSGTVLIQCGKEFRVNSNQDFMSKIQLLFGHENIEKTNRTFLLQSK